MLVEKSLIVYFADISSIRNDNKRDIISTVLDGLLHLRKEEFAILSINLHIMPFFSYICLVLNKLKS